METLTLRSREADGASGSLNALWPRGVWGGRSSCTSNQQAGWRPRWHQRAARLIDSRPLSKERLLLGSPLV